MTNKFKIYYECKINVPEVYIQFEGHEPICLKNGSVTEVDIDPGRYTLYAVYRLIVGENVMDFNKKLDVFIEEGCDYDAKVCMVLKSFSLLKRFSDGKSRCC